MPFCSKCSDDYYACADCNQYYEFFYYIQCNDCSDNVNMNKEIVDNVNNKK
jgi:hypothetical protein